VGSRGAAVSVSALSITTLFAVLAPHLAPYPPDLPVGVPFSPPFQSQFIFGTDQVGRDVLSRVLAGLPTSWLTTIGIVVVMATVGTIVGVAGGFFGGIIDRVLTAVMDFFLALPGFVFAIVIAAALGPSLWHAAFAIMVLGWPYYARLVRSETRALMHRPHIEAARLANPSRWRLLTKHVLPGTIPVLLVNATLDLGGVIITLASLSFLGLGAPDPAPELGAMTAQGLTYLLTQWWIPVIPALVVMLLALIANLSGDGIRSLLRFQ
jgi:peptide/nickel transport system permease protein